MANVQEKSHATTATAGDAPHVEVYDNDKATATPIMRDGDRALATDSTYATATRSDVDMAQPATNWTSIILGILVVLALIMLVMWLL